MERIGARIAGMGLGCIFLTLFAAFWLGLALADAPLLELLAGVLVPASLLLLPAAAMVRAGRRRRAAEPPPAPAEEAAGRRMGRAFGLIFGAEFAIIAIAANLLATFHHADFIPAVVALIVGLHFLPLARVFQYPLYFKTGGAVVALAVVTLAMARRHADAAAILTGLGMALILWITVFVVWRDARRLLAAPRYNG